MKKLNELLQERAAVNDQINVILDSEEITEEQRTEITELETTVDELKTDIELLERQEKRNAEMTVNIITNSTKDEEAPAFTRSLNEFLTNGHVTADFKGVEGFKVPLQERADPLLSTTDAGSINKFSQDVTIKKSFGEDFLRNTLGLTFFDGILGNITLPGMLQSVATVTTETGTATSAAQSPVSITLAAQRIDAVQGYNRAFLSQTSTHASLVQDLVDAIGVRMVYSAFDSFNTDAVDASVAGTVAGVTYSDVLGLEANLADIMGEVKFAGTPAAKQYLRNLNAGSAGIKFVWDNDTMLGHQAYAAGAVNTNNLWLGDWSKAYGATFGDGGVELLVDPYSGKEDGFIEVYAVTMFDAGIPNYRHFSWLGNDSSMGV